MNTDGATTFYSHYVSFQRDLSPAIRGFVENTQGLSHKDRLAAFDGIAGLRSKADDILARYVAVITPSSIGEAP